MWFGERMAEKESEWPEVRAEREQKRSAENEHDSKVNLNHLLIQVGAKVERPDGQSAGALRSPMSIR